jgi:hypothetical protein
LSVAKTKARRGGYSKFGSMRILRDGRVRFSARTHPGLPELDYLVIQGQEPARDGVVVRWRGTPIFHVFTARHRVESTCFDYTLTPEALREAVSILRDAGNGLERWIVPGLQWCQRDFARMKSKDSNREALMAVIPQLLSSAQALSGKAPRTDGRKRGAKT